VGALANLGYPVSDQTMGKILKREKTTTWHEFIRTHMDVLVAMDFFITEVWTWYGLVTYYRHLRDGLIHCHERLGGLLRYYDREAA
jgi:hypothetical protein